MRRVTLDANVLAPGFTSQASASARLIDLWRAGAFVLVLSEHLLGEVARTFADPYFAARLQPGDPEAIVALLGSAATLTDIAVTVRGVATHPEDDLVLATALSGRADVLCTRDRHLLRLGIVGDVVLLSPGELVARLTAEGHPANG